MSNPRVGHPPPLCPAAVRCVRRLARLDEGLEPGKRLLPEFQHFQAGDAVPLSAVARLVFYAIEPERYLIWTGENGAGTFTWALHPVDENHTRLVSRIR